MVSEEKALLYSRTRASSYSWNLELTKFLNDFFFGGGGGADDKHLVEEIGLS
jgi:hypothetical protein